MNSYRLTATPLAPLVVRRERQSQRSEGVESLSGTLLRGALAQLYLEQHGQADGLFHRLFLDAEACRYGPLDPAEHVFPSSAATCKRHPGFVGQDEGHGIVDLLWLRIARRIKGSELSEEWFQCGQQCAFPHCRQDLKPKDGFWTLDQGNTVELKKRWRRGAETHVGIDRYASSAHESILYTLPVLIPRSTEEKARLTGVLQAGAEEVEHLRRLLASEDGEIRVGHARTRGYGRVRLEVGAAEPRGQADPEAWSGELITFLKGACEEGKRFDPARHFFFSLGLPAGALLLDRVLRYTLDPAGMVDWLPPLPPPEAEQLRDNELPCEGGRLFCLGAMTRHERLRGWNAAHGLPRQDEWIVSRGAVYAYLFEGDEDGRRAVRAKLAHLEETGLGARRVEGLGRVIVSDEIHQRFHAGKGSS